MIKLTIIYYPLFFSIKHTIHRIFNQYLIGTWDQILGRKYLSDYLVARVCSNKDEHLRVILKSKWEYFGFWHPKFRYLSEASRKQH